MSPVVPEALIFPRSGSSHSSWLYIWVLCLLSNLQHWLCILCFSKTERPRLWLLLIVSSYLRVRVNTFVRSTVQVASAVSLLPHVAAPGSGGHSPSWSRWGRAPFPSY